MSAAPVVGESGGDAGTTGGVAGTVSADVDVDVLLARAYLNRVAEPASVALWLLVRELGPIEAARRVRAQSGVSEKVRSATYSRYATVDPYADLETAERHGMRLVVPESAEWPAFGLAALENAAQTRAHSFDAEPGKYSRRGEPMPPLALWAAGPGDLRDLGVRSVGIVGARASTTYGEQIARSFGRGLAERDVTVISGGAYGIDAAAHRGALDAHGRTVLVSAGGLDACYPRAHEGLFRAVRETGVIVSESPPGRNPTRVRFLTRNRLIASLSTGTVIVEAATRSGAMNTAGHCELLGRPLMVVPGPITSTQSAGCHLALRKIEWNATAVTSVDEVLELVGNSSDLAADAPRPPEPADRVRRVLDALDDVSRRVFDGFPAGRSVDADELILSTGLGVSDVLRSLPVLELARLIEIDRDGFRIRR